MLGFLYILCPSGNMSAPVKYIFCLCFVCCVTATAISIPAPDFTYFDKVENEELLTEQNASIAAQGVFYEALKQQNINFKKIVVDTNKLADGSIIISKVTVYSNANTEEIMSAIGSDVYEVEIVNE